MANFLSSTIEGLFFQVDTRAYWDYRHFGLPGEDVKFAGPDNSIMAGIFMPAYLRPKDGVGRVRGTVLFAHSCFKNMKFNIPQVTWLVTNGFNVFTYDPRGCGETPGDITLAGCIDDARAAFDYLRSRPDVEDEKFIFFGQGPGAYALMHVAAENPAGLKGLIVESVWDTNAGYMIGRYGPGIGHLCAKCLPEAPNPGDAVAKIRVPMALMVGGKDRSIPKSETEKLIARLRGQTVWTEPKATWLHTFASPNPCRDSFIEFARDAICRR